ncbi:MAG: DUF664 domain-containing protein [Acidobacteria bacterium]|nr:DUF664 domain-containing protein [Acidobacteriota bacterium]
MEPKELLVDLFGRIDELVLATLDGISSDALNQRPLRKGNSIAWLIWHLTRVEDGHIADVAGTEHLWTSGGFAHRAGLALDDSETGYGHTSAQVDSVQFEGPEVLADYHQAVANQSRKFVESISAEELDRVVDTRWDPPVTLGVRLVSVLGDCYQHAGQAAYVRGLLAS